MRSELHQKWLALGALTVAIVAIVGLLVRPDPRGDVRTLERLEHGDRQTSDSLNEAPRVRTAPAARDDRAPSGGSVATAPVEAGAATSGDAPERMVGSLSKPYTVNVRELGATGDGRTNDGSAIQRANDTVASHGGGVVFFPRGVYMAMGVLQDSFVTFTGAKGAVLKHIDGVTNLPILRSRLLGVTGSIAEGSKTLGVKDTSGLSKGGMIAIRGAGGASATQRSDLASSLSTRAATLRVGSEFGFADDSTDAPNYVLIDREIISYSRMVGNSMYGLVRGLYGTARASHSKGAAVAQLKMLYAHVVSITKGRITIDRPARFSVRDSSVRLGSVHLAVRDLGFDGNRRSGGAPKTLQYPIEYNLARFATVAGCTVRNGDDGAVIFQQGTEDSLIENNTIIDSGNPSKGLGSGIWLYRGSRNNTVRKNRVSGSSSFNGILIDDRTIESSEWDGDSGRNLVERNDIDLPRAGYSGNIGIGVLGSSDNLVRSNAIQGSAFGIRVYTGGQSPILAPTTHNVLSNNSLNELSTGLWTDGIANRFLKNLITNVRTRVVDKGKNNEFD